MLTKDVVSFEQPGPDCGNGIASSNYRVVPSFLRDPHCMAQTDLIQPIFVVKY